MRAVYSVALATAVVATLPGCGEIVGLERWAPAPGTGGHEPDAGPGGSDGTGGDGTGGASPSPKALWSKRFGDAKAQTMYAIAVDAQGAVLPAGYFQGSIDLDDPPLYSQGGLDGFVARFDGR